MSHPQAAPARLGYRFWLLWTGQAVSLLGSWLQYIAVPLWILEVTGSASHAGALLALETFARIIVSPYTGVLVDRFDRRTVIIAGDICSALIVAVMFPAVLAENIAVVNVGVVLLIMLSTITSTAIPSILPRVVPRPRLQAANSAFSWVSGTITIFSPVVGVLLNGTVGLQWVLVANLVSYGVSILLILPMGAVPPEPQARQEKTVAALRTGVRALWDDRVLRSAVLAESAIFLFFGSVPRFTVVLVGAAEDPLQGAMFPVGMGVGWAVVSLLLAERRIVIAPATLLLWGAALTAPVAALAVVLVGGSSPALFVAGLIIGAHNLLFVLGPGLLAQTRAPNAVIGRVLAFRRVVLLVAQMGSFAIAAALSELGGALYTIGAVGVVAGAIATPLAQRAWRISRTETAQPAPEHEPV